MEADNRHNASTEKPRGRISSLKFEMKGHCTLEIKERNGKILKTLSGEHFSEEAIRLLNQEIIPEVKDNNDWLFLVEGGEAITYVGNATGEVPFAVNFAEQNKIPVRDPIVTPYDLEVIELYVKTNNDPDTSYERIIGSLVLQSMKDMESNRIEKVMEPIAAIYDMSADRLLYCLQEALSKIEENLSDQFWDWEKNLRDKLLDTSNVISIQILDYYLRSFDANNVLLYCGKAHKPMIEIEQSQIPSFLKLTDLDIEHIASERLKRYRRINERIDRWSEKNKKSPKTDFSET